MATKELDMQAFQLKAMAYGFTSSQACFLAGEFYKLYERIRYNEQRGASNESR